MGKRLNILVSLMIVASLLVLYASTAQAKNKQIELSFNHMLPPMAFTHRALWVPWAKAIEERTKGMVHIEIYPGSALSTPPAAYDCALKGVADIAWYMCSYNTARFPLSSIFDLPIPMNGTTANLIIQAINKRWPDLVEAEFSGVKLLYWHGTENTPIHLVDKTFHKLEDLKGLRIRAPGNQAKTLELAGAVPVHMPGPDIYLNLQRGIIDGAALNWPVVMAFKLNEVTKYSTTSMIGGGVFVTVMNLKTWNSLPKDIQKIIDEESHKLFLKQGPKEDKYIADVKEKLRNAGHEIYELPAQELDKWKKLCKPLYDEWIRKAAAKGLPGRDILDLAFSISEKHRKN